MTSNDVDHMVITAERQKQAFFNRLYDAERRVEDLEHDMNLLREERDSLVVERDNLWSDLRRVEAERDVAFGYVERMAKACSFSEE